MKGKILLLIALLLGAAVLAGCGSSGSGNSSAPGGINTGIPSVVRLLPVQYVGQTNSFITFRTRVIDGNGNAVPNTTVNFTNMSLTGVLSATTATTDIAGNAEVRLSSTTSGFATILAQVNTAAGQARDQKTVFFTSSGLTNLSPFLVLDVDGNGNGIYNEPSDFILFEPGVANDNQVIIRATVFNGLGLLVTGSTVTFGSDAPSSEVTFPLGSTATTDSNGQAFVLVQVTPTVLTNLTTVLNITALADNGAFNMVSLFLEPVTVSTLTVSANPTSVDSGGDSTITAAVTTSAGTPAPDGTTVTFTVSGGGSLDTPFAQTTDGVAKATLTAPVVTTDTSVTVTAKTGGKTGSVSVAVKAPTVTPPTPAALAVTPALVNVSSATATVSTFTIAGGTGPYTVNSSCANTITFNDNGAGGGTANDGFLNGAESNFWNVTSPLTFKVTVPAGAPSNSCTLTVTDNVGATKTATLKITSIVDVTPTSATIHCTAGGSQIFTVTGISPFTATSSDPGVGITGSPVLVSGGSFTATVAAASCASFPAGTTPVTVTVGTAGPPIASTTVTVNVVNP